MICRLCKDYLDPENPFTSIYARSPLSFRFAWMHLRCFEDAYECLAEVPSKKYKNKQDEYLSMEGM